MIKKVSFSGKHSLLEDIHEYYVDSSVGSVWIVEFPITLKIEVKAWMKKRNSHSSPMNWRY